MAKAVANSASRALGLLIVKGKIHGGSGTLYFQSCMIPWFGQLYTMDPAFGELETSRALILS